ncbi:hypothetical protein WL02_27305 [Burkholderia ubonensis]|uniref:hypothetical protein n=1 Tax=Burkholderia ubonensis TaxID=101571 RepID=UPI00075E9B47|nr:hypothetical protein [Burkholderia ubonensis]KVX08750.1 hypothetical protein WL02_27305 [Burkholderia ubonensis]KVZ49650.1 hypothetical protein WL18_05775 [Burkholderia ubonensis]
MAKIVAVHGIGQQLKGENTLHAGWLPALRDGLTRAGRQLANDHDLVCPFYGDLFRPKGKSMDPPYIASDVIDDQEAALLQAWWSAAVAVDPRIPGPDARTKAHTPQIVQRALYALSLLPFFKGVAEAAMIFDLKQVRLYMNDAALRAEVQSRVTSKVGEDTRVLVGHSLGSVVAYEALWAHPEWKVHTFVTVGSPLGIRNLIFDYLHPAPHNEQGAWPGSAQRWVNISDRGDVVALVKDLGPLFSHPELSVSDLSINNGATAHDIAPYLTAEETGHAIAAGL